MKKKTSYFKIILTIATVTLLMFAMCVFASASESAATDLRIAYCNLSFESDTHIMYAIKSNDANVKLLVWSEPQNEYTLGTQKTVVAPLSEQMTINGELYTVFKYTGVAAKQMTDNVYVRACIDNGNGDVTYGDVHKYSVLQYAYNKLGKTGEATTNEKLINLINATLAQGAAAQEYHNYKTDRLATDEFVQVKLTEGTLSDGFKHGLYLVGESVTISAPVQNADGTAFTQWKDKSGTVIGNTATYALTVGSVNNTYTPEYLDAYELEYESYGDGTCYLAGMGTFSGNALVIPDTSPTGDKVVEIDADISANITAITIPKSITTIAKNAFSECTALTDVYYGGTEAEWNAIDINSRGNTALINATKHFAVVEETYTEPTIVISSANAAAGDTNVEITVALKNNPGIASLNLLVAYDEGLTLTDIVYNSAIGGMSQQPQTKDSPVILNWFNGTSDTEGDWIFATLKFSVASTATAGDYDITLTYDPENVYDITETNIAFDVVAGKIAVS